MPHYRGRNFTDITLMPAEERRARKQIKKMIDTGGTGEMSDRYRLQPPSKWEKELSRAYHDAATPQDRITVLEYWILGLHRIFADMTRFEQGEFGYRIQALLQLAQALINRELRAAQIQLYEQHLDQATVPTGKIVINTWTNDLTRIHEAMQDAGMYSEKTEVSKIVGMYYIKKAVKDVAASYRASKAKIEEHSTYSAKLLKFLKILASQLNQKAREELADHCVKARNTT